MSAIPFGIKYSRAINFASILIYFAAGTLALIYFGIPSVKALFQPNKNLSGVFIMILAGLLIGGFCTVPGFLLIKLNKALFRLRASARVWQIVVSFIGLFLIPPIGTLLYAISLYFMFFDSATKNAFTVETTDPKGGQL